MAGLRVVVCGAGGRTGGRVVALAKADKRFFLAAGVVSRWKGSWAGDFPLLTEEELPTKLSEADAIVDFSVPAAAVRYAALAAKARKLLVTGTTGLNPEQTSAVRAAGKKTAVFLAPNFSPGMAVLAHLARAAGAALPDWDASIVDLHHAAKRDAPSGSALRLAEAVRPSGSGKPAALVSLRAGDVVGDHTLTLAGPSERIELVHRAQSRDVFARGALDAALWLRAKKPGVYGMADKLGLR